MSRIRWFLAGAAVTAGALAAAPGAYQRLRSVVEPVTSPLLTASDQEDEFAAGEDSVFDPIADDPGPFVPGPPLPEPMSDDTMELRARIDETRARIHERAQSAHPDGGGDDEETTSEF